MQTSASSSAKRWVGPVVFAVALAAVIMLSGRPVSGPDGKPLINNMEHYNQLVEETRQLVEPPFATADSGRDLTDADRAALRKAVDLFDAQSAYQPRLIGPYLGAGKAYALLGEDERAEERLTQLISNVPLYDNNENGIRAAVEARYVLSGIRLRQGKLEEAYKLADEAVKAVPNIPNYLVARASAAIELRKMDQAQQDILAAQVIDPNHARARQLAKLIDASEGARNAKPKLP